MINENSNIRAISFINNKEKFTISEKWLNDLKGCSYKNIDNETFDMLVNEVKNGELKFQFSPQEINYINKCDKEKLLDYILYRYKFIEFPRKKISTKFPIYILIEPVSSCNLKCGVCFQSDPSFIKKEFMGKMSFELFKKVIDEAEKKGTKAITFGSRGEPSIHPQIIEFIDYAKNKFLEFKFITNATKLTEKLIHKILSSNINLVQFSIDSEDKKIYEEIRKFSNFDKVLENVKNYNEIKNKFYSDCKTNTRISGLKVYDYQSDKSFHNFWKQYADEIVFKEVFPRWDTYNNKPHPELNTPCRAIWERMYVWFDGKTNPCDADYKSNLSYGNVNEDTIENIWNSDKLSKLKINHLKNKRNTIMPCDRCGQS